jgi:UDP-N-acetylglucosamine 1-carboxyvinyltransferase
MMAAALAEGTTIIENAAKEPEVSDLATSWQMGAKISGIDTDVLVIEGVENWVRSIHYDVLPDRWPAPPDCSGDYRRQVA